MSSNLFGGGGGGGDNTTLIIVAVSCSCCLVSAVFMWYAYTHQDKFPMLQWLWDLFKSEPAPEPSDEPAAGDGTETTSPGTETSDGTTPDTTGTEVDPGTDSTSGGETGNDGSGYSDGGGGNDGGDGYDESGTATSNNGGGGGNNNNNTSGGGGNSKKCKSPKKWRKSVNKCMPPCAKNKVWSDKAKGCVCKSGFRWSNNKCVSTKRPNGKQCEANKVPKGDTCVCLSTFKWNAKKKRCEKRSKYTPYVGVSAPLPYNEFF